MYSAQGATSFLQVGAVSESFEQSIEEIRQFPSGLSAKSDRRKGSLRSQSSSHASIAGLIVSIKSRAKLSRFAVSVWMKPNPGSRPQASTANLAEVYTQILLTKILTPHGTRYVDMQSPAGQAWNVLVYNYDGDVYASDESRMLAEMKDWTFRLGNVHRDTRRTLFTSGPALQMFEASCNQALAGCSDCAFQSYCAADPVYHHATQGDMYGNRATSGFCSRNMEVFSQLFSIIENDDRETMRILWSWVLGSSVGQEVVECA